MAGITKLCFLESHTKHFYLSAGFFAKFSSRENRYTQLYYLFLRIGSECLQWIFTAFGFLSFAHSQSHEKLSFFLAQLKRHLTISDFLIFLYLTATLKAPRRRTSRLWRLNKGKFYFFWFYHYDFFVGFHVCAHTFQVHHFMFHTLSRRSHSSNSSRETINHRARVSDCESSEKDI